MTYDKFLEETNILTASYEADRQELADKYSNDIQKLADKFEEKKAKAFEEYRKYQETLDVTMLNWVINKKEKKILDKLSK